MTRICRRVRNVPKCQENYRLTEFQEALGLSAKEWANEYLGGYLQMELAERRAAVREMAEKGLSQRKIGQVLGVGKGTVSRDLNHYANESKTNGDTQEEEGISYANESKAENLARRVAIAAGAVGFLRERAEYGSATDPQSLGNLRFVESLAEKLPDLFGLVSRGCRSANRFS
jgi:hypothetical protein